MLSSARAESAVLITVALVSSTICATLSTCWAIAVLGGNSMQMHSMHRLGMWVTLCFVLVHVYAAIREDIMSRQSLISTMISGWRMFKD